MQCNGKTGYRAGAVRDTVHLGQVLYLCVTLNFTLRMHRSSMYKKMYVEYALCKTKKMAVPFGFFTCWLDMCV